MNGKLRYLKDRFAGRIHNMVEELSEQDPSVKAFVEWSAS